MIMAEVQIELEVQREVEVEVEEEGKICYVEHAIHWENRIKQIRSFIKIHGED